MSNAGDSAPGFTLPIAGGEVCNNSSAFTLPTGLGDGPIVLAFFPVALTTSCTEGICPFRDSTQQFNAVGASVDGISVDLPPARNISILREQLPFPMLSDRNHAVIHGYGVVLPEMHGQFEAAKRSVFPVNTAGRIPYRRVEGEGETEFTGVVDEVRKAVPAAT